MKRFMHKSGHEYIKFKPGNQTAFIKKMSTVHTDEHLNRQLQHYGHEILSTRWHQMFNYMNKCYGSLTLAK